MSETPSVQEPLARKCPCKWCTVWSPLFDRINEKLSLEDQKLFEEFLNHYEAEITDGHVAQAKLDGTWPGWGWLPAVIKENKLTTDRVSAQ